MPVKVSDDDLSEVGGYAVERRLGAGGMGVVYLARSASGEQVAVKVIRTQWAQDPEFRARFELEVAAARMVHSAFTAPVVNADPYASRPWMASLFVPGQSLSARLRDRGPLPEAGLRDLASGLAQALRDIHRTGLVHRDLKPSNVLLTEDRPCVVDFGVARAVDGNALTRTGETVGTPPFMAPEQFVSPREAGAAVDVFALGSVLAFAATGRSPFDAGSPHATAFKVVHEQPDLDGVPDWLMPVVTACLAKEPARRPTPEGLLHILAASSNTPLRVRTHKAKRIRRILRSKPGAGITAALLVAGVATGAYRAGTAADDNNPAAGSNPAPASTWRAVAEPSYLSRQPWQAQYVSKEATHVTGTQGAGCLAGGGAVYCGAPSGTIVCFDAQDGTVRWQGGDGFPWALGNPIAVFEHQVYVRDSSGRLRALDARTGSPLWTAPWGEVDRVLISGSTAYVRAYAIRGVDGITVRAIDLQTHKTRWSKVISGFSSHIANASGLYDLDLKGVTVLEAHNGTMRHWKIDYGFKTSSKLRYRAAASDALYVTGTAPPYEGIVRIDLKTHKIEHITYPGLSNFHTGAISDNIMYFVPTNTRANDELAALDTRSNKPLWRVKTTGSVISDPVITSTHVYVVTDAGSVIAYDKHTGKETQRTPQDQRTVSQTPSRPQRLLLDQKHLFVTDGLSIRLVDIPVTGQPAQTAARR
ncbi:PQQ-binding-like beta-propeller repeat protein [Streptomyces sp. NBC_00154]|uniref:serine/threonine-protein kinase n=1 Tax=Streptomyces sp. NBC_00154 TaxID=2975670 RepID=UPI0022530D2F|nr:serine/threonine-protein kinase [Streptomyces sp. NBC_00154]MCX5318139.1 serine/threonine-protein kinase [Streptomyces sp. NBC_00154]